MIDAHVHYAASAGRDLLNQIIREMDLTGIAIQCIPKGGILPVESDAFAFKARCSVPVYVFGGINREIYQPSSRVFPVLVDHEITRLLRLGCTGIKMLEGKPDVRKRFQVPDFDSELWEGYWRRVEQEQIPVYLHMNDPEEFWDAERVADYVKKAGWFYDETFIGNEEQYRQILTVLSRHPKLKILFPHFFFMSAQLDRLGGILDAYKNVRIDITPGIELYYNLSEKPEQARQFFHRYQDRILYGSDIGARTMIKPEPVDLSLDESRSRVRLIRRFLETKGDYILEPDGYYVVERELAVMHGLGLSEKMLEKIYEENFISFIR